MTKAPSEFALYHPVAELSSAKYFEYSLAVPRSSGGRRANYQGGLDRWDRRCHHRRSQVQGRACVFAVEFNANRPSPIRTTLGTFLPWLKPAEESRCDYFEPATTASLYKYVVHLVGARIIVGHCQWRCCRDGNWWATLPACRYESPCSD